MKRQGRFASRRQAEIERGYPLGSAVCPVPKHAGIKNTGGGQCRRKKSSQLLRSYLVVGIVVRPGRSVRITDIMRNPRARTREAASGCCKLAMFAV
jgi:hypothetical protein